MKTPLLSGREADSAGYLTAAEILKGQLVGYPTDTYAHNGNEDLDRLQREHPDWSIQLVANGRGSGVTAHRRDGQGGLVSLFAPTLLSLRPGSGATAGRLNRKSVSQWAGGRFTSHAMTSHRTG